MTGPTIYDVARESGYSIKTVSRVINGENGVRAQTVALVEAAIRRLDYHPNPAARRLGGGRLPTIGLIVDSLDDPFFSTVTAVTEQRAMELGMDVLVASTRRDPVRVQSQLQRLVRRGAAGLLIAPFGDDDSLRLTMPDDIPVVVIDRKCGIETKDVVRVTDLEGGRAAVTHLIEHGHRRIGFFGQMNGFSTIRDRYQGYQEALAGAGISVDPALVESGGWAAEETYPLALAMLAVPDAPTAVFAATPTTGIGVLQAMKRLERQDIALVVFGDFPLSELMTPPTTVVDQQPSALANTAFDHLVSRLGDNSTPPSEIVLPTRLIPRGSGELTPLAATASAR